MNLSEEPVVLHKVFLDSLSKKKMYITAVGFVVACLALAVFALTTPEMFAVVQGEFIGCGEDDITEVNKVTYNDETGEKELVASECLSLIDYKSVVMESEGQSFGW